MQNAPIVAMSGGHGPPASTGAPPPPAVPPPPGAPASLGTPPVPAPPVPPDAPPLPSWPPAPWDVVELVDVPGSAPHAAMSTAGPQNNKKVERAAIGGSSN
jgi:hypothetical protein